MRSRQQLHAGKTKTETDDSQTGEGGSRRRQFEAGQDHQGGSVPFDIAGSGGDVTAETKTARRGRVMAAA